MTLPPGIPEAGGFADRFARLEAAVRRLEQARPGALSADAENTYLKSGSLILSEDGSFAIRSDDGQLLADFDKDAVTFYDNNEDPLAVLDRSGVSVGDAPVVLDEDGLDIGNGLTVVDALGLAVGSDVEIDADGLKINGLLQPDLRVLTDSAASNPDLTTSEATVNEVQLSIPSFADEVSLMTFARLRAVNNTGSNRNIFNKLVNDVGGVGQTTDEEITVINGTTGSTFLALTTTVSSPGSTITCRQRARATDTGVSSEEARLEVIAIVRRT